MSNKPAPKTETAPEVAEPLSPPTEATNVETQLYLPVTLEDLVAIADLDRVATDFLSDADYLPEKAKKRVRLAIKRLVAGCNALKTAYALKALDAGEGEG